MFFDSTYFRGWGRNQEKNHMFFGGIEDFLTFSNHFKGLRRNCTLRRRVPACAWWLMVMLITKC